VAEREYIGSSVNIEQRWAAHRGNLRSHLACVKEFGHPDRTDMERDCRAHGLESFAFTVLEEISDPDMLAEAEQRYITERKPAYNLRRQHIHRRLYSPIREIPGYVRARVAAQTIGISPDKLKMMLRTGVVEWYRHPDHAGYKLIRLSDIEHLDVIAACQEVRRRMYGSDDHQIAS